jgi:hypothetical protein
VRIPVEEVARNKSMKDEWPLLEADKGDIQLRCRAAAVKHLTHQHCYVCASGCSCQSVMTSMQHAVACRCSMPSWCLDMGIGSNVVSELQRFTLEAIAGMKSRRLSQRSMHFQPIIFEDGEEDEVEVGGLQPGASGQLDVPKPGERLSTAGSGGSGMSGASMGRKGSGPPPGGSAARPPGASPAALVDCPVQGTACLCCYLTSYTQYVQVVFRLMPHGHRSMLAADVQGARRRASLMTR